MIPPLALRTTLPLLAAAAVVAPSVLKLAGHLDTPSAATMAEVIAVVAHVLLYTLLFAWSAHAVFMVPGRWSLPVKLTAFLGVMLASFAGSLLLTLVPYLLSALVCYGAKLCSFSLFAEQLTNAFFVSGVQITAVRCLLVCVVAAGGLVLLRKVRWAAEPTGVS